MWTVGRAECLDITSDQVMFIIATYTVRPVTPHRTHTHTDAPTTKKYETNLAPNYRYADDWCHAIVPCMSLED